MAISSSAHCALDKRHLLGLIDGPILLILALLQTLWASVPLLAAAIACAFKLRKINLFRQFTWLICIFLDLLIFLVLAVLVLLSILVILVIKLAVAQAIHCMVNGLGILILVKQKFVQLEGACYCCGKIR
jgi:hypothetical protein